MGMGMAGGRGRRAPRVGGCTALELKAARRQSGGCRRGCGAWRGPLAGLIMPSGGCAQPAAPPTWQSGSR